MSGILPEARFREFCTTRCRQKKVCRFCCIKLLSKMLQEGKRYEDAIPHIFKYGDKKKLFPCLPRGGYFRLASAIKKVLPEENKNWPVEWVAISIAQVYKDEHEHNQTEQQLFEHMFVSLRDRNYPAFTKQASSWYSQFGASSRNSN